MTDEKSALFQGRAQWLRFRPSTGVFTTGRSMLIPILVGIFLFALPIIMLGIGAFRNAPPGLPAEWSFDAFGRTFSDPNTYKTFGTSVFIAVVSSVLSVALALILVFLVARTTTPLRRFVTPVMVLVIALPPLFYAMSWGMLGNPHVGMINTLWFQLTGLDTPIVNSYSLTGLIAAMVIKGSGFCYMLLLGPFRAIDRSIEEAAQMSGAGRLRTIIGIDLAVLMPAITGVVILNLVIGFEAFDLPLFLGTPANIDVFSTQIYSFITDVTPADYGGASSLSLVLVVLVGALVWLQQVILGRRRYTTVSGKSYNTTPWNIGGWRWVGTALIVVYVVVGVILPLLQLVLGSFQPFFGGGKYSTINYEKLFNNPATMQALGTTILIAIIGGAVAMAIAFIAVYAITHNETWLRRVLDGLTWLPFTVPGIVLALGLSWTYVTIPGLRELYGTVFLVALGLIVAAVPIATRALQPALIQINRELEDASRISGARPIRVVMGTVLPLVMPTFLAGWFVVAIVISGNLTIPVLLSNVKSPTVPFLVYQLTTMSQTSQAAALLVVELGILFFGTLVLYFVQRLVWSRTRRRLKATIAATTARADVGDASEPSLVSAVAGVEAGMEPRP
jgi:iron(III) transport system permease protein